jgi:pyruvate dehydrogenase E1 component beta subunit
METPRTLTYSEALHEAIEQEMARDKSVFIMGQGIDDCKGMFGTTTGLIDKFGPDRIFDTPLAEEGMTGIAIGAAMAGMRPIHTHIRMDFMLLAMNQLINIAAKSHYMYGGSVSIPMVIRSVIGRSWGQGSQHSQGLHSLFMHIPGLRVVAPTTPYDAKGALIASIRENNPVIFVEHRMLYSLKGHVPQDSYSVPLGKSRILSKGDDVTIVGISHAVVECMRAKACLDEAGISAEVIDPIWLSPLDIDTIADSVERTGILIVVDSGWTTAGASSEIVAAVGERLQDKTHFKFKRMGFAPVPCPTTKNLERLFYPDAAEISSTAYSLVRGSHESWKPEIDVAIEISEFKGPF